jgi:hypothetical protein
VNRGEEEQRVDIPILRGKNDIYVVLKFRKSGDEGKQF